MIATMKLDAEQEAKLVQRCLRREQEAWDELVSTYAPGIQYRIKCITKPNDLKIKSSGQGAKIPQSDLADEICQEVFVKLIKKDFKNLRSYNPAKGKLSTWLTKITINTAKDYWRRKAYKITENTERCDNYDSGDGIDSSASGAQTPEEAMDALVFKNVSEEETLTKAFCKLIDGEVSKLPPEEQLLYKLKYTDNLTLTEIRQYYKKTLGESINESTLSRQCEKIREKILDRCKNSKLYRVYIVGEEK